jgi:hypothetical protein
MSRRKKNKTAATKTLGSFFIKKGKLLTSEEYTALGKDQPIIGSSVKKIFGSYAKMVNHLQQDVSLLALIKESAAIQAAPKVKPKAKPKATPKAKPASKPGASTTEK